MTARMPFFIQATTWADLLRRAAARWPDQEIVFPNSRATLADLERRASAIACALHTAGVCSGDHVGVLLPPGVDLVAALFAIAKLGAVVVPVSERFKAAELRHVVIHSDMTALVTTASVGEYADFPALLHTALPELAVAAPGPLTLAEAPRLRRTLLLGQERRPGFVSIADLDADGATNVVEEVEEQSLRVRVADHAFLMYTSGTSAHPKGCLLTHESVTRQAAALAQVFYRLGPRDAFWCPLPLFHNGGTSTLASCLASGARFVHGGRFDPSVAVRQIVEERCTHWIPTFETILIPILDEPSFAAADTSHLRLMVSAGSPEYLDKIQRRLPTIEILSNYGSTEGAGSSIMAVPGDPLELRMNTCGHPFPGMEFRVIDPDTGVDCPTGVRGELLFRGPQRFEGYYKDPELTAAAIDPDGWFHTGDLASVNEDGLISYLGRAKDMLKVGGENVAAAEVEAYLLMHPAVNIVSVVGAPDAHYTEVAVAYVELVPGATATEDELIEFCVGQIATFKVPRYVRFVTEWPMSGTKIQKFALREWIARELERRGVTEAPPISSRRATRA